LLRFGLGWGEVLDFNFLGGEGVVDLYALKLYSREFLIKKMLPLQMKWEKREVKKDGKNSVNVFGFEPIRYSMQTNMIGRVNYGTYVCRGCGK